MNRLTITGDDYGLRFNVVGQGELIVHRNRRPLSSTDMFL